jgi:gliding motility-associated-like protein
VNSNADSGTGTLRAALLSAAANGTVDKDFIHFNLPDLSEAGRTIRLLSQLPDVSSNVVIDGATQLGTAFGKSTAKIQLITDFSADPSVYGLAIIEVEKVEVYGLYIRNFIPFPVNGSTVYQQGIAIRDSKDIKIGAANKGNVISGFSYDIGMNVHLTGGQIKHYSQNISIKNCFIGVEADGETFSPIPTRYLHLSYVYGLVEVGGTINEGNLLPRGLQIYQANSENYTDPASAIYTLQASLIIYNNRIGTNFEGTAGVSGSTGLWIGTVTPQGKNTVKIEDNIISSDGYGIYIGNNGRTVHIKRNYIGTDRTLTKKLPVATGIFIYGADDVNIGGEASEANYIANCKPVNVWPYSKAVVRKNSFFCTVNAYPMIFDTYGTRPITKVAITQASTTAVSGTATPNAVVDLYYTDLCGTCAPETYFATVPVDAAGNWKYNGPLLRSVVAAATFNGFTSEFTKTEIDVSNLKIINTCGDKGSILGAVPMSANSITWLNEKGEEVGHAADLVDVPAGKYRLVVSNGTCNAGTNYFEIRKALILNAGNVTKVDPSCGNSNGSISGLVILNNSGAALAFAWKDASGATVGQNQVLNNIKAGTYTLFITTADKSCTETYGPITLTNTSGPNINELPIAINPSSCQAATGSIDGLIATGTGTLTYTWKNDKGATVGTALKLINQPSGEYSLVVGDQSNCGQVISSTFFIPATNGVTLADNGIATAAKCGKADGTIDGILVTGATSYEWYDNNDNLFAKTPVPKLVNANAGNYYLIAYNASCSKKSKTYTIGNLSNTTNYQVSSEQITNASCAQDNGAVSLNFSGTMPASYRWVAKANGQSVGTNNASLTQVADGLYELYLADENGCEKLQGTYRIDREPEIFVNDQSIAISSATCGLANGSISGITVSGKAPFAYQWTNANGTVLSNSLIASNLKEGSYTLRITDAVACTSFNTYTIDNKARTIAQPMVNSVEICGPGAINLTVNDEVPGYGYRLYESATSVSPIAVQMQGKFSVTVNESRSYFMSAYSGDCESARKEIKIKMGYSTVQIPNTFTPNGDGVNDRWQIKDKDTYNRLGVTLFNRNGAKVYTADNYQNDFEGIVNGKQLPIGTYYYVISFNANCASITGTLTILR